MLAVIGIAAAIVLYCDLRSFIAEQAEAQEKTIRVLSEMSVRLQTIEHRMEVYHMQPPSVTKQSPPYDSFSYSGTDFRQATPLDGRRHSQS